MSSGLCPGTPRIASSSAECRWFQAHLDLRPPRPHDTLLPHFPRILLSFVLYLPLYTSVYIPQLHFIQHGTYGQPAEESLFTEESRSPHWESPCTCIAEDSQSSLPIKCFNRQPSLRVQCWIEQISALLFGWSRMMTIPIGKSAATKVNTLENPPQQPISKKTIWTTRRTSYIQTRHAVIRQYELHGFHCQRNGAVQILSLHALHFQICDIQPGP